MMKIEFMTILALAISGMINYLVSWLSDDERERNLEMWGKSGPSSIKDLVVIAIFSLVSIALGLYLFFGITDRADISYVIYGAIFEGFMISLYLSIKFIGKNGDLHNFGELLSGYAVIVPMIALIVLFAFIPLGYVDLEDPYSMTYGFALIALGMIIFGAVKLSAEVIYFRVKDMARIDRWNEKILSQEKKVFYALIVTTIVALILTM